MRRSVLWFAIFGLLLCIPICKWHHRLDVDFKNEIIDGYDTISVILAEELDQKDKQLAEKRLEITNYKKALDIYEDTIVSQIEYIDELEAEIESLKQKRQHCPKCR